MVEQPEQSTWDDLSADLRDALGVTIGLWEESNRAALSVYTEDDKRELVDNALYDLTSSDDEDENPEPMEPIGEEAFENSYIGNGGSPDPDNL